MSRNEERLPNPQKFSWKAVGVFKSFEEADSRRKELLVEDATTPIKVRRCGPEGRMFKVKVGKSLETGKTAKSSTKTKKGQEKS